MSKSIWHTADVKPKSLKTFVYKTDEGHIGTSMLAIDSGWNPVLLPEFYSMDDFEAAEHIIKWCYLDDLLALETELDRTRKALDVATKYIKHTQKVSPFWFNRLANETLDKIKTALEQKD